MQIDNPALWQSEEAYSEDDTDSDRHFALAGKTKCTVFSLRDCYYH